MISAVEIRADKRDTGIIKGYEKVQKIKKKVRRLGKRLVCGQVEVEKKRAWRARLGGRLCPISRRFGAVRTARHSFDSFEVDLERKRAMTGAAFL